MKRNAAEITQLTEQARDADGVLVTPAKPPLLVIKQSVSGRNGRTMMLTLRSESGRRRIVYDIYESPSGWREKKTIPKRELPGAEGELSKDGHIPLAAIIWAEEHFSEVWESRSSKAQSDTDFSVADGTPIGLVFDQHRQGEYYRSRTRKEQNSRDHAMRIAETVLGRDFDLEAWDNNALLKIGAAYKAGITVTLASGAVRRYEAESNTTVRQIAAWLRTIFSEAQKTADPRDRRRILVDPHRHPFDRSTMPAKAATRVVRHTHSDFAILYKYADVVEPKGRFRAMLVDARYTGYRLGTICPTGRSDILLTAEEIADALERALCVYVDDHEIRSTAEYYASRYGAIHRRWEIQKQGATEDPSVAQYDRVIPLGPRHRSEIDHYIDTHWERLGLPRDAPLYPTDLDLTQPMYVDLAERWFRDAVELAEKCGERIVHRPGTLWKGFRSMRRTELKRLEYGRIHEKDIAFTGGWSIHSFPDSQHNSAMTGHYLGIDPDELMEAVSQGEGNEPL